MRVGRISSNSSTVYDEWIIVKNIYSLMFKFYLGKKEGEEIVWIGHNLAFFPSSTSILKSTNIFFSLLVIRRWWVRKDSIDINVALFVNFETILSKIQSEFEWRMEYISSLHYYVCNLFKNIGDMDSFVPCLTKKLMVLLGESWERGRGRDSLLGALYSKDLPVPFKKR